jgi:hypothetical protein
MATSTPLALRTSILYVATALGGLVFGIAHLFHYVAILASADTHDHGDHNHLSEIVGLAEPNSPMMWMVGVFFLLAVVPIVLPLVATGRVGAWATMVVGAGVVILNVLDGVNHGLTEGAWPILFIAVVGVGVPGVFALWSTWSLVRAVAPKAEVEQ